MIRPLVPDYPMNLVEVRKIPKEIREKLTSDFRLIAEYAARRQDPELLEELLEDKVHTIKHPEEFLDMLSEVASDKRYKNAWSVIGSLFFGEDRCIKHGECSKFFWYNS